jgi:hypothetical protein
MRKSTALATRSSPEESPNTQALQDQFSAIPWQERPRERVERTLPLHRLFIYPVDFLNEIKNFQPYFLGVYKVCVSYAHKKLYMS